MPFELEWSRGNKPGLPHKGKCPQTAALITTALKTGHLIKGVAKTGTDQSKKCEIPNKEIVQCALCNSTVASGNSIISVNVYVEYVAKYLEIYIRQNSYQNY